jgi:hypothetical protein
MAQLKNAQLFSFNSFDASVKGKPVGNNRTVTHVQCEHERQIIGSLHGHAIMWLALGDGEDKPRVYLDTCGYLTTTTIAAMNDFLNAAQLQIRASRAGGSLSVMGGDADLVSIMRAS